MHKTHDKDNSYVSIVGGTNIDIQGVPYNLLIPGDSNMGFVKVSNGGVGRNIGENLVRLGIDTKLISVIGDDPYGKKILNDARLIGLDMEHTLLLKDSATSIYLSILDESHDMALAISYMEIYDKLSIEFIKEKDYIIEHSALCIIDTNIPIPIIEYILKTNADHDFILDTVSTTKAKKVKDLIGYFHTIKPNKIEAEVLTGIKINSEQDLIMAAEHFINKGVKRVFITLGDKGIFYSDGITTGHIKSPKIEIVNTTGAGDAFTAALAYAYINNMGIEETAKLGVAASLIALSHQDTINPNMSISNINSKIKEI